MISAVVLTKNEEKNIVDCIESLSFCDEVIVIDDNSEDRTVELAKREEAKVFTKDLNEDFAAQRNFGLTCAKGDWVLFVDADERVTPQLVSSIKYQVLSMRNNPFSGYKIKRIDFMWGKEFKYGETADVKLIRLARKDAGKWEGKVHEVWKAGGNIGMLTNPLLHYPHQTVSQFLQEINFYTNIRAKELYDRQIKAHWWSIILYPKAKFIVNYFVRLGFRDGLPGLVFALMMSLHSFLVRAKLWKLWNKQ